MDDVNNEEWLVEVGTAMGEKERVAERYSSYPEEKVRIIFIYSVCTIGTLYSVLYNYYTLTPIYNVHN